MRGDSSWLFAAAISVSVVALMLPVTLGFHAPQRSSRREIELVSRHDRKLLQDNKGASALPSSTSDSTDRMGDVCTIHDLVINHGVTPPMPSGIPTYMVTVLNLCLSTDSCDLANIHLSCGAFSSALLINPRIFRRLRINDCLLNDGRPLPAGSSISFQYANSFPYPLAISSASCSR